MQPIIRLSFACLIALNFAYSDTITSRPVGPGIMYHEVALLQGPWQIDILEIDLNDTMNTLETVKAMNNIAGYERTSSMASRSNTEGHRVVGAINGDFYSSGGVSIGVYVFKASLGNQELSGKCLLVK